MDQPFEVTVRKILHGFREENVSKFVITGEAGAGKTWVARKVCNSAFKEELSCGSIWIFPVQKLEEKDLLDVIASQLSIPSSAEELDYDEDIEELKNNGSLNEEINLKGKIREKVEAMSAGKPKSHDPDAVQGTAGKTEDKKSKELEYGDAKQKVAKYLFVVLDDVTEGDEEITVNNLKNILPSDYMKILVTRKESTDSHSGTGQEGKEDAIRPSNPNIIRLELLNDMEALALLKGRVKDDVPRDEKLEAIAKKALGLPAAITLIAEALNHSKKQDADRSLENAVEDAADLREDDIIGMLRFVYEMLPAGVERDCYWLSRQLFVHRDAVHFNELITYWILEGCFDNFSRIEKAYEEGHHVLMELKDRGMLKGHGNYVFMERAMSKLLDERRNGFSGAAKLRLADACKETAHVLCGGRRRIILADGMIRTVYRDKEKKEISTLVIDGCRLDKEVLEEFSKSMKGLKVLAIRNPVFESLPRGLTELKDLQVLVLRGCRHLKNADWISRLDKLSILEISGASLLGNLGEDFFKGMTHLKSVNLSGINATSMPNSLFGWGKAADTQSGGVEIGVRFLILRECPNLITLPKLKNMKELEIIDLCGSSSFNEFSDGRIHFLEHLKTFNVSGTNLKRVPIFGTLGCVTRVLLSNCGSLNMVPSMEGLTSLEVLDLSGSEAIKNLGKAQVKNNHRLRILDISRTKMEGLALGISNISHLHLNDCSDLKQLPPTKALQGLVFMDLAGASKLVKLEDESFEHLKLLRQLNLSRTEIEVLPTLSHLVELRELLLKDCKKLKKLHVLTRLEKLEVLDLSGCCSLTLSRDEFFNRMSRLKKLDLSSIVVEGLLSLESLSKLEELNLNGVKLSEQLKAGFLRDMTELKILNLSKTHVSELPSFSHLTKLRELYLSGTPYVPSILDLENLTELEVLDLSETDVESLPSLRNYAKLRELLLVRCSNLKTLKDLDSVSGLEVLDLSSTGLTHFPYEVNELVYLKKLHLPSVKQMQVNWSEVKYLPADLRFDPCDAHEVKNTEITASASTDNHSLDTESRRRPILVRGTRFFRFLEEHEDLWDTCFKEFHFSVWLEDAKIMEVAGDMSLLKYLNPGRRFPDSGNCSILEIHGCIDFPDGLKGAFGRAQYISVIDNKKIGRISDLGEECTSSVQKCWFERCPGLHSIFAGEEDIKLGKKLESLYLSNLPSLVRLYADQYPTGTFSNIKDLHLDCCPKLVTLFSSSNLPVNLETLKVKFCDKLTTLFEDDGSTQLTMLPKLKNLHLTSCPELVFVFFSIKLPVNLETLCIRSCSKLESVFKDDGSAECEMLKLKSLQLLDLPALKRIGAVMPALENRDIQSCPNLEDGSSSSQMSAQRHDEVSVNEIRQDQAVNFTPNLTSWPRKLP